MSINYREIPYNYTSLTDKEIILKYLDSEAWDILEELRSHRVTGKSAKMLFEIIGDIFIIDRNPYISNDFSETPQKLRKIKAQHKRRLEMIEAGASNEHKESILIKKTRKLVRDFFKNIEGKTKQEKKILSAFSSATNKQNIKFSAFHKVAHCTDATDWRIEYPEVIIYPDSAKELPQLVKIAQKLGLKIIARGGGTGLTGGAVPVVPNTLIINTEKLNKVGAIEMVTTKEGKELPIINLETGVITNDATAHCKNKGYVFATDPTSAWASSIGGNIAENAGGKKAVMWGCCIDNLYSFKMVLAGGRLIEVERKNHPHRKIEETDIVEYETYEYDKKGNRTLLDTFTLKATEVRKKGLGKDITNKALGGVPGIQKEGGDGIIYDTRFVLYTPFNHARTICLEFYGTNMVNASKAIVEIRESFGTSDYVFLTALEHFDDVYMDKIDYNVKSNRNESPKAVLLIDVESNDENAVDSACKDITELVQEYNTEGFIASDADESERYWKDRKNLGAIAKHTNGFKTNEDIVVPIKKMPGIIDFFDKLNAEKELDNSIQTIEEIERFCESLKSKNIDGISSDKVDLYIQEINAYAVWCKLMWDNIENPTKNVDASYPSEERTIFKMIQDGEIKPDFNAKVIQPFHNTFKVFPAILDLFDKTADSVRRRKIIIATHMHAGDGNIHVNIPVHSSDHIMMHETEEVVDIIFKETIRIDGVVSGEHGIGIAKLKYLDESIMEEYAEHKKKIDPSDLFNPGKLAKGFPFEKVYTPSFNLLELEAFVLEATDLQSLSESIANCVRCGKCKPVCNTHYPEGTMFYSPRNKILGVGLIMEAVLYDTLTSNSISFRNFKKLTEIAQNCTMCHRCEAPCPVNIDFGDVTLNIKKLLNARKKAVFHPGVAFAYFFLSLKGVWINQVFRFGMFKVGYRLQRLGHALMRPFEKVITKTIPGIYEMVKGRYPMTTLPTLREQFKLSDRNSVYTFHNPDKEVVKTVFYFPGCGSERMFPQISLATIAMFYDAGVRVVIPPQYVCCGYPFKSAGKSEKVEQIVGSNKVLFHKIAKIVDYMNIESTVVTCGTCYEMLSTYGLENIFPESNMLDANDFLVKNNLIGNVGNEQIIYHEPCHSPLKDSSTDGVVEAITGSKPLIAPNCCGEVGTLAISNPYISNTIRERKQTQIQDLTDNKKVEVLTTCPACTQGLSKIHDDITVEGKHMMVYLAEKKLGKNWMKDFFKHGKKGLEKSLL
ncbi:MAG: DUF3683 domain-containing protein [Fibrobacterales bacterium]